MGLRVNLLMFFMVLEVGLFGHFLEVQNQQADSPHTSVYYCLKVTSFLSQFPHSKHTHVHTFTQKGRQLLGRDCYCFSIIYIMCNVNSGNILTALFIMYFAMAYIALAGQVHSHQGAALQSVLCWWLLKSSISKG